MNIREDPIMPASQALELFLAALVIANWWCFALLGRQSSIFSVPVSLLKTGWAFWALGTATSLMALPSSEGQSPVTLWMVITGLSLLGQATILVACHACYRARRGIVHFP